MQPRVALTRARRDAAWVALWLCTAVAGCAEEELPRARMASDAPAAVRAQDRVATQTSRITTEFGATCAVFGVERQVFCWGMDAQLCRPRTCAPEQADLPPCRLFSHGALSRACAVRPLSRPIRGAVAVDRSGAVIAASKADGRMFVVEPSKDLASESEREYPPGLHAVRRSAYFLLADGRIFERVGLSAVAPESASGDQRIVRIDMRFTDIAGSLWNACGLALDGVVYCWGSNVDGQLGIGDVPLELCGIYLDGAPNTPPEPGDCTDAPQRVTLPSPVRHLAGNKRRTRCATLQDGTVWWWGEMPDGKPASLPRQVKGVQDASASTCGQGFGCALLENGRVSCWGRNDFGQLGIGSTAASEVAVSVPSLTAVTELSAGPSHVCAITDDRALYCFGSNGFGELGDGTFDDRQLPVQVQPPGTIAEPWSWPAPARPH